MAQGDLTMFEEFSLYIAQGDTHDLNADAFKLALVSVAPSASLATPVWADISANEVSGTGYTAGGAALTTTWTEAAGTATFDATGAPAVTWTQNGAGPSNIKYGVIYNDTSTTDHLICFIDFTTDGGTTAISLIDGDITWTPNASGIFTLG